MNTSAKVDELILNLRSLPRIEGVFNPWEDQDPDFDNHCVDAPAVRRQNLKHYLMPRIGSAKWLLLAEAPGYNGCKFTGIPMTSERQLIQRQGEIFPGLSQPPHSSGFLTSQYVGGRVERTASIVWGLMCDRFKVAPHEFILWNSFPCHPYKNGNRLNNGKPTSAMIENTRHILNSVLSLFPGARIVTMGKVAKSMGVDGALHTRHPANDFKREFTGQLESILLGGVNLNARE